MARYGMDGIYGRPVFSPPLFFALIKKLVSGIR